MHPAQAPLDKDALAKYQAQWTEAVKTFYTSPFAWYYTFPWWSMWCAPALWLTNHRMLIRRLMTSPLNRLLRAFPMVSLCRWMWPYMGYYMWLSPWMWMFWY